MSEPWQAHLVGGPFCGESFRVAYTTQVLRSSQFPQDEAHVVGAGAYGRVEDEDDEVEQACVFLWRQA